MRERGIDDKLLTGGGIIPARGHEHAGEGRLSAAVRPRLVARATSSTTCASGTPRSTAPMRCRRCPAPRAASEFAGVATAVAPAPPRDGEAGGSAPAYAYEGGHCEAYRAHERCAEARPRTSGEDTRTLDVAHSASARHLGRARSRGAARDAVDRAAHPRRARPAARFTAGQHRAAARCGLPRAESAGGRAVRFRMLRPRRQAVHSRAAPSRRRASASTTTTWIRSMPRCVTHTRSSSARRSTSTP
jgi:hypothetical protein